MENFYNYKKSYKYRYFNLFFNKDKKNEALEMLWIYESLKEEFPFPKLWEVLFKKKFGTWQEQIGFE